MESPEYAARSLAGYDVVTIIVDGLRADRVEPETMPFLSAFANESLRFSDAASNSSFVLQSLASFFTGRPPTAGGTIGAYEAEPHDQTRAIAQYFADAGYYTGLLANHPLIQGTGFTKGFEEIEIARPNETLDDAHLVQRATEFLEDAGDDRVFLYVHLAGVLASPLCASDPAEDVDGPLHVARFAEHYATAFPPSQDRLDATVAAYDAAMRMADQHIQAVVHAVREAGRAEKTLFIVTSLNGFELLEHRGLGSGWTVFEESIRVPLVLHADGALPEAEIATPISLVNFLPTVISLVGLDDDGSPREGQTLFEPMGEVYQFAAPEGARIAEVVIPERCIVRSATVDGVKYVSSSLWADPGARFAAAQSHKDTANAFASGAQPLPPLWGANAFEATFNLRADPLETTNLLQTNSSAADRARAVLTAYREHCAAQGIAPRVATQFESALDAEQLENLESLGYL